MIINGECIAILEAKERKRQMKDTPNLLVDSLDVFLGHCEHLIVGRKKKEHTN